MQSFIHETLHKKDFDTEKKINAQIINFIKISLKSNKKYFKS